MSLRPDLTQSDYELLSAFIDNMLADDERALLEERLKLEPGLRDELSTLQQTVNLIVQLPSLKAPRDFILTPDMVRAKPQLTVLPRPSLSQPRRVFSSLVTVMSAAASMMLVVLGMILLLSGENGGDTSSVASAPGTGIRLDSNVSPDGLLSTSTVSAKASPMPTEFIILPAPPEIVATAWTEEGGRDQDQADQSTMADSMEIEARGDTREANAPGAVPDDEQGMTGGGEAPLYAQAPAPMTGGEQEAPAAIELDSDDTMAFEDITPPMPSLLAAGSPPAPLETVVEGYSESGSRAAEDRERSAAEHQIQPSPTDPILEAEPPLTAMQPTSDATGATVVAEALEESVVDEVVGADDGVVPGPYAEPSLQTESSDDAQNNTLLGVLLIAAGCAIFISLIIVVWLQRQRA